MEAKPKKWIRIENIISPERLNLLDEIHLELTKENFSTLIPNDEKEQYYKGYVDGLYKAISIINNKIYENKELTINTPTRE